MKRPAFQFYPADWRKDAALQGCSIAARGLWIEMTCIMHECEPYGHLVANSKPLSVDKLARLVGEQATIVKKLLDELEDAGVFSYNDEEVIFSRRMVKDEEVRNARAAGGMRGADHGKKGAKYGKLGGRPSQKKGDLMTPLNTPLSDGEKPAPSSSSSTSVVSTTSIGEKPPPKPTLSGSVVKPVDELATPCETDPFLQAETARRCNIHPDRLQAFVASFPERLQQFVSHLKSEDVHTDTPQNFRSRFKSWLAKRLKGETESATTTNNEPTKKWL